MTTSNELRPGGAISEDDWPRLPAACQKCGFYKSAQRWNIPPEEDQRTDPRLEDAPWILVFGQHPGWMEDERGRHMVNPRRGGGFLREFLEALDVRWILDEAVGCYPGKDEARGRDREPKKVHIDACATFRGPVLRDSRVRCIVTLGMTALRAVLGKQSPRSLSAAGSAPLETEDLPPVIALPHPFNQVAHEQGRGGRDVIDDYVRGFKTAEEIALGTFVPADVPYVEYAEPRKAIRALKALKRRSRRVYFDYECVVHDKVLAKKTIWHPESRALCISLTYVTDEGYETVIVYGPAMNAEVIRAALAGMWVGAWNLKFDAQCAWVYHGVDIFSIVDDFACQMSDYFLRDQSVPRLSLKIVGPKFLGVPDWGAIPRRAIDKLYEEKNKRNRTIDAYNRALAKVPEKWQAWLEKCQTNLATSRRRFPKPPKTGASIDGDLLDLVMDRALETGDIRYLREEVDSWLTSLEPLPRDEREFDFGDLDQAMVRKYCAGDTWVTARLGEEFLYAEKQVMPGAVPSETARMLIHRGIWSLARIEREGLPVSLERIEGLREHYSGQIQQAEDRLLELPEVRRVLPKCGYWRKAHASFELPQEQLREMVNPNSPDFYRHLIGECFVLFCLSPDSPSAFRVSVPYWDRDFGRSLMTVGDTVRNVGRLTWDVAEPVLELVVSAAEEAYGKELTPEIPLTEKETGFSKAIPVLLTLAGMFSPDRNVYRIRGWDSDLSPEEIAELESRRTPIQNLWRDVFRVKTWRGAVSKDVEQYIGYVVNNRIHTSFRLVRAEKAASSFGADAISGGVITGRTSSTPNVQNLKDDELFRNCFVILNVERSTACL